jgi:hypothetical protein
MCVLFVFVFFDARAQARTYKSFSKFFFGIEMYFLMHCACCRDVLGPLGRTESRYFRARKCPTRIIFSDLIRVGMCRSRLKLPVSLFLCLLLRKSRARIQSNDAFRARVMVFQLRVVEYPMLLARFSYVCRISLRAKKKATKSRDILRLLRAANAWTNGIETECSF